MAILGTSELVEQPKEWSYSKVKGFTTTRTWKGKKEAISAKEIELINAGWDYTVSEYGKAGFALIRATIGGDQTGGDSGGGGTEPAVADTWELLGNRSQKDVLEMDLALMNSLTDVDKKQIRKALTYETDAEIPAWENANSEDVYSLLNMGVTSGQVDQPILRHTWTVPYGATLAETFSNIGCILSTATLISSEGVPQDFLIPLSSVAGATGITRTDGLDFYYGWLKGFPSLSRDGSGNREVHQEWEWGLWSGMLYGASI